VDFNAGVRVRATVDASKDRAVEKNDRFAIRVWFVNGLALPRDLRRAIVLINQSRIPASACQNTVLVKSRSFLVWRRVNLGGFPTEL
jgi:hypothetical protein